MIAQTIQLALTPVFVLVAIGGIMNILSTRLGRVVDRSRALQDLHASTQGHEHDLVVEEIRLLDRRIGLIGQAILLLVCSGLSIGLNVALLFVEEFAAFALQPAVAGVFMLAIALLMAALVLFLKETRLATSSLRVPETYLQRKRES